MMCKLTDVLLIFVVIGVYTPFTKAQDLASAKPWHIGCYKLQSNISFNLLDWFENPTDGSHSSGYYSNYNSQQSPPVYGTTHCPSPSIGLPYVAVLSPNYFYCIDSIEHLLPVDPLDGTACLQRCSELLPCGSSNQQYVSVYNSSYIPHIQNHTFREPLSKRFTHRILEYGVTITLDHPYGFGLHNASMVETQVPVKCHFNIDGQRVATSDAVEEAISSGSSIAACSLDNMFTEEGTFSMDVEVVTDWERANFSRTVIVSHEVPISPDIVVYLSDFELPTCISNQQELLDTEHHQTVKVYIDTPTPFKASIGQGFNVTFDWTFDNVSTHSYTSDSRICSSTCYHSIVTHTFTSLGVHEVAVSFTNSYGSVETSLSVIVVSKDIHNVTVSPENTQLRMWDIVVIHFTILTSTRYFTYVKIDLGDGNGEIKRFSAADPAIFNIDQLFRPKAKEDYTKVTSSYGVGCLLSFDIETKYVTREGHFNLTWTVFNNGTTVNSSEPILYSVYNRIEGMKFQGHTSYQIGMTASMSVYFDNISHDHTTKWTLVNAVTGTTVYTVTEERGDVFTYVMNETGTFTLQCETWNPVNERAFEEITVMVLERLGNLTVEAANNTSLISTHRTLTFRAHLDSGLGAEYVWNVTALGRSPSHVAPTNLGLTGESHVTFVRPDVYNITVYARIGSATTSLLHVQTVHVYERITYVTCLAERRSSSDCAITASVKTGSSVNLTFYYPNETFTRDLSALNHTTVNPRFCPGVGIHEIDVVASNPISTLELKCPVVVPPAASSLTVAVTAAYHFQLQATITPAEVEDYVVYNWRYSRNGEMKEEISALPLISIPELSSQPVSGNLIVYGLKGGLGVVYLDGHEQSMAFLNHQSVVKPSDNVMISLKNTEGYTNATLNAFTQQCTLSLANNSQAMCSVSPTVAQVSNISLSLTSVDGEEVTVHSAIAVVPELPDTMGISCPSTVVASSQSQELIRAKLGEHSLGSYYVYYTWYRDHVKLAYTAGAAKLYGFQSEGQYNVTVVASNAWGSVSQSCIVTATNALIELEIKPAVVHRLQEWLRRQEPTAITLMVYGPRTLANLTVDYGDGENETYSANEIVLFDWTVVDSSWSSTKLYHRYPKDKQYRVHVTASTTHTTLNATGIVYRSVSEIRPHVIRSERKNYEVGESVVLMTTVGEGDYLTFDWLYDGHVDVIETSNNHSKARVTMRELGRPAVYCKVYNPAYPEGILANFTSLLLVVVKPAQMVIGTVGDVTSAELSTSSLNVTFYLRYSPGPDRARVTLWGDSNAPISDETIGICKEQYIGFKICIAYGSHVYDKTGRYNVTMQLMVGDFPEHVFMIFEVLPPKTLLIFSDAHKIDNEQTPTYYFPFGDVAKFSVELQTVDALDTEVVYHWSFGDQSQQVVTAGPRANISYKYMSMKEAGFNVSVRAETTVGDINVAAIAKVNIYKPIQRVELLVQGKGWTTENQGKLYFLPEQLTDQLLLVVKVYPDNVPFESCHIVKGYPYDPPSITNSFIPENTEVEMYAYDDSFLSPSRISIRKLVLSALCVDVRPPDVPVRQVYADVLTVHIRSPLMPAEYRQPWQSNFVVDVKVGNNLTYDCYILNGFIENYYKHYLNGELLLEGMGKSKINFIPDREGIYNLTCDVSNGISETSTTLLLPVLNFSCDVTLSIIPKELVAGSLVRSPAQWYSSEVVTLQGTAKPRGCELVNELTMRWEVTTEVGDDVIEMPIERSEFSDLYLPPRTLPPGNYLASFIVSIPGTVFVKYISEPLSIVETPFRAIISGGIAREIDLSISQMIELDASQSYDPDCPDCDDLNFIWACNILHHSNASCFIGSSALEFASGMKTRLNSTHFVNSRQGSSYQISLVVSRGSRNVVSKQTLESTLLGAISTSNVEATCETCTDGPHLESSIIRPVVFKTRCSSADPLACQNVRYTWMMKYVPYFSAPQYSLSRRCGLRETKFITTPAPTTTANTTSAVTSTVPTYISTTTPVMGALGSIIPTEEESEEEIPGFPFPIPIEDDGSGNDDPPSTEMSSAVTESIFDNLDYSHAYGFGGNTRRRPYTTTTTSYSTTAPSHVILPGCGCAIDGDLVVTNFNTTLYEKEKERVANLAQGTLTGFNSKEFIIKRDILKYKSTYLVQLSAQMGSEVVSQFYRLNTGSVPETITCYPSFSKRDAAGSVTAWYAFADYPGEELFRGYEFQCNFGSRDTYSDYEYVHEVYIERIPGELEIVSRAYTNNLLGHQILPAGFPECNYTVYIEIHVVDIHGNRYVSCPGGKGPVEHQILPKNFTGTSATDVVYDLVHSGDEYDWYDEARTQGHVFTIRNNMLAVCEILNRVSATEVSSEEKEKRMSTRSLLLRQLMDTPHRYMAEVEQKLVVLRSIVKVKPELDSNSTALAADLLVVLVDKFIAYEPRDRPRDVNFTTHMVIDISSKLVRCLSANEGNLYGHTAKLERIINTIIMASVKDSLLPTSTGETTRSVHGMTIVTSQYTEIKDETIGNGDVSFMVPAAMLHQLESDGYNVEDCHTASMIEYASNPFKQGIDSVVTALTLYDCDGREMKVNEMRKPEAHITFKLPSISNYTQQTESNFSLHKQDMNFHVIEIARGDMVGRSLNIVFKFAVYDDGHTFPISVLIRRDEAPTPHKGEYDIIKHVGTEDSELQLFLDSTDIGSASKLYLAVADANFNAGQPRSAEITERLYNISTWWSECVYWDTEQQDWSGRGCSVTRETTLTLSHCSCNHFTAFASKREVIQMLLYRHAVDKYFSLRDYPTTKVMVSLVIVFYVVLAVVCYVADRKSPVQEKVIAIQDNSPSDRQRYIITIETGSEPGSGTTAKVSLVLHGEEGMSGMRELIGPADSNVFLANSRDTFLLTLPANLGPIWKVQLWHNNKGSSPGWYVKRVTVRDVESGQSYYFLCEQWLAVEENDGKVEREFMALDSHIGFKVVFKVKAPQYFNDYHLIRSLIYKPTFSHFSRVERLTCVFVGLLAHMVLCTAYFYIKVEEYRGQYNLFDLSSTTVLVSLVVNVVACPLMLILSMIFRRSSVGGRPIFPSKDKKYKMAAKCSETGTADNLSTQPPAGSHTFLEQSVQHWQSLQEWAQKQWEKRYQKAQLAGEELSAVEMQMQEQVLTLAGTQSNGGIFSSRVDQSKIGSQSDVKCLITNSDSDTNSNSTSSHGSSVRSFIKSRRWFLPPWCRLLAWFMCIGCATSSAYATIYYSSDFQEGRFVLWLQSIFVTFLFCNFIIQPLGILSKAVATAVWYRRDPTVLQHFPDRYEDDIEEIRIRFSNMSDEDEITRGTRARQRSRYLRFARPPQEKQLIAARKRTMKEKKLIRLGAECFVLALNLCLLVIMVFCCERDKSFSLNRNIKSVIATTELTARHQGFRNISRPGHMWDWLQYDLKDLLFTEYAHNLGSSIIIGNATRIKQVRVQEEACEARDRMPSWTMRDVCHPPYSRYTVDKETYNYGNNSNSFSKASRTEDAVLYGQLTSYTESGYELLLPVNEAAYAEVVEQLKMSGWVDKNTRAVFIELTIYHLPTNLYCSVTALLEFSATGQIIPSIDVDSAKLYRYRATVGYMVLTAELIFIFVYLCQLHFNIMSVVRLQKKYFTQIWNILDCMYMVLSLAYIVIYLYRFEIVEMLHNELRHSFHSAFVSVAPLVFWDRVLCLLLGLLFFITLVKTLKLFRYVKTFARLGNVYRRAARDIRAYAVFFLLLIITYTNLGVLLFQPVSFSFSDYWHGMMSVTAYLSGSTVSYSEFEHSMPFWGGAYMILLSAAGHAVLVALIIAILSYHFRDFKQDTILAMDLKEAAGFMFHKVVKHFSRRKNEEVEEDDRQVLSPEFALAEMEYQVDELLFKMSALCDGVSLPSKPSMYYNTTDSDGTLPGVDDVQSARMGQEKMEDEASLARLLHLQSIGTELRDGEQAYNRSQLFQSQLELDVLRQLQMSHPRDVGINVWDNLRGVSVESAFSDTAASENDIPIHRHDNTVYHSYQRGESEEEDNGSFISIPDESHTPFHQYTSGSPAQKHSKQKRKKQKTKKDNRHCAKAEVYELTEHSAPVIHDIEYHNDAYASDVEVELDIEYTPAPYRVGGGFIRKTRSMTHGAYQNQAYNDDEGEDCQQTGL